MKVLIADDEPLACERLAALLQDIGGTELVARAANGREAIAMYEAQHPECVVLDVQMPVMDGLEAARHFAQLPSPPAVVFCTAHDEHALAAFDASAVDYLVKPVRRERLAQALQRARRLSAERVQAIAERIGERPPRTHLCARVRGHLRLVPVDEVLFFLAGDKYVAVNWTGGEVLIEESLRALEEEFGSRFLRIHRNCLIAVDRITGLLRQTDGRVAVELRGASAPLEVSRRSLPALRKLVREI